MSAAENGDPSGVGASPGAGHLLPNLLLFGRLLRRVGLDVNPGRMLDLVRALEHIEITREPDFYFAARGLLVHRHEDIPRFDRAFEAFWRRHGPETWLALDLPRQSEPFEVAPQPPGGAAEPGGPEPTSEDDDIVLEPHLTYSAVEVLREKDFADLDAEELQAVKRLIGQITWKLGARRTRRMRPGSGAMFDLRRTVRRNLRHGGEVVQWARRTPKRKPRPLVVIADVSGSMERYTRLLLQFMYSLAAGLEQHVEAFVFSTRLTRITQQLRQRDVSQALREVSRRVPDWSGGTRIGEVLKTFNFHWARRVLSCGAVVLLISDGWDRGDVARLQLEIARLQRSCRRLIWLNPLLGSSQYEPLTRGMRTALPYVDDFLPLHSLASLESLASHLMNLPEARPTRRQHAARATRDPMPRQP